MIHSRQTKPRPHRGTILVAVLVSLLVVMLMGAALTEAVVMQHRQMRVGAQRQQSFWLAESASQRALRALAQSADYAGEMWQVPAESLGGGQAGVATIEVEKVVEPNEGWRIRVEARYPDDPVRRVLHRREMFVNRAE